jgi:hypothetical protein
MTAHVETNEPTEDKHSINWGAIILLAFVVLLGYALSIGPVVMLIDKKVIAPSNKLLVFYLPLERLYIQTPFHKPLGLYLRLWSTRFDKNGDQKDYPQGRR